MNANHEIHTGSAVWGCQVGVAEIVEGVHFLDALGIHVGFQCLTGIAKLYRAELSSWRGLGQQVRQVQVVEAFGVLHCNGSGFFLGMEP